MGDILDIGCGGEKICASASGVDVRKTEAVDFVVPGFEDLSKELVKVGAPDKWDTIFSSHCLEHLPDDLAALRDWANMLKSGGHLILYLPCDRKYDNDANPEHLHRYTHESFLSRCIQLITFRQEMELVESANDYGHDRYSFYYVWKKS